MYDLGGTLKSSMIYAYDMMLKIHTSIFHTIKVYEGIGYIIMLAKMFKEYIFKVFKTFKVK